MLLRMKYKKPDGGTGSCAPLLFGLIIVVALVMRLIEFVTEFFNRY